MQREVLQRAVQVRPFKPFRLYVTGGGSYLVRHPELCLIGLEVAFVALNKSGETDPDWETFAIIDLAHISRLRAAEDFPPSGQQATG